VGANSGQPLKLLLGPRVIVCGPPGAGKAELASRLGEDWEIVELDRFYWDGNFKAIPDQTFRNKVFRRLGDSPQWVVVGNHRQRLPEVWEMATGIVWLDIPLEVCSARIAIREKARRGSGIESIASWLPKYWQRLKADYTTLGARYPGAVVTRLDSSPQAVEALRTGA